MNKLTVRRGIELGMAILLATAVAFPSQMDPKFAQTQQQNAQALRQYAWKSRTEIRKSGETKNVQLALLRYDSYGLLQKTPISSTPQQQLPTRGLRGWTIGLIDLAKSRGVQNCIQRATKVFGEITTAVEKVFQSYDVILSPVMTTPPYKIGWHDPRVEFKTLYQRVINDVGYTPLHNGCGTTAMSVPLHWTPDGLPVGSQFAAWRGGERTLLQLAYELEAARPWAGRRPPVFAR